MRPRHQPKCTSGMSLTLSSDLSPSLRKGTTVGWGLSKSLRPSACYPQGLPARAFSQTQASTTSARLAHPSAAAQPQGSATVKGEHSAKSRTWERLPWPPGLGLATLRSVPPHPSGTRAYHMQARLLATQERLGICRGTCLGIGSCAGTVKQWCTRCVL